MMTKKDAAPDLHDKVTSGSAFLLVNRLAIKSMDVIILMVLTRCLLPSDFGRVAIAISTIQIIETVLELQTGLALLQVPVITRSHLNTAFTITLLRGLAIMAVLMAAAVPLARFYRDDHLTGLICALSVVPLLRSARSPKMVLCFKHLDFMPEATADLIGKIAALALAVAVGLMTRSYWAIAIGAIAAPLFFMLSSYVICPFRPAFTLRHRRLFYGYMGWGLAGQICSALNWQTDRFVLGKMVSHYDLGLFTAARDFAGTMVKVVIETLMRPIVAGLSATSGDKARLVRAYGKVTSATMAIGLPVGLGQAMVGKEIVAILLGAKWASAASIFSLVSLALIPALYSSVTTNLFYAIGRPDLVFQRNLYDFLFRFPATIVMIALAGLQGAVYALIASEILLAGICLLSVRKLFDISVTWLVAGSWRSLVSGLAMTGALALVRHLFPHGQGIGPSALYLMLAVPMGAAVYLATHLLCWSSTGSPEGIERYAMAFIVKRLRPSGRARPCEPSTTP
ncbi:MAG: oligosaccharide flippase family protein [Sphingomonadales bacterium]|nr:oligosaccharide flippase family protein [Sphingomonadales bacterium]MDE2171458.1 oligosaccharide flippase family protein [Sphingomonadales bacterium]